MTAREQRGSGRIFLAEGRELTVIVSMGTPKEVSDTIRLLLRVVSHRIVSPDSLESGREMASFNAIRISNVSP